MSDTGFTEKLRNLTKLVEMGEAGLERMKALRLELLQEGLGEKKVRAAIQKGSEKHVDYLKKYEACQDYLNADATYIFLKKIPGFNLNIIKHRDEKIKNSLNSFLYILYKENNKNTIIYHYEILIKKYPFLKNKLNARMEFVFSKKIISDRNKKLILSGKPLSSVHVAGGHAIGALNPCAAWDLLIDESGTDYGANSSGATAGRIVGVLVPSTTDLPDLPDFHATLETPERVDQMLQKVLNRSIGIFGISVQDIPCSQGERWMDGVCEVIHWVWQQLPLDPDQPAPELNVFIENRGNFDASLDLRALNRELLRQWAGIDPRRAVKLSLKFAGKGDHKHLGYADAVAFTWGSPAPESKVRLAQCGLLGGCLQDIGSGVKLRNLRDFFARPELVDGEYWKWLLGLKDSANPYSLSGQVLGKLAATCRRNGRKWDELTESLFQYLESKALDLRLLGSLCRWLEDCRPHGRELPKPALLMLRVAQLATENHLGKTGCAPLMREVAALGDELMLEDARLVCRADLHLAVQPTNEFQFELAGTYMERWRDFLGLDEMGHAARTPNMGEMVLGLKLSGRVKSTLGQHLAFLGHHARACDLFEQALRDFERLSDKNAAAKDGAQTGTYLALASMDDPQCPPELVRQRVENVLGPLDQAVTKLARDVDPELKYSHHLLLRYLEWSGDAELSVRYLDAAKNMRHDYGHPWQLIQFYRVWLARRHGRDLGTEIMRSIWDLVFDADQGATVTFIGMAIGAALGDIDPAWEIVPKTMGDLRTKLPGAQDRLDRLEQYLATPPADGMQVMRDLLPFNFR